MCERKYQESCSGNSLERATRWVVARQYPLYYKPRSILYPAPTVWSAHVLIAIDESGQTLLKGLQDETVQELAWKKHGFRTGSAGTSQGKTEVTGIADSITQVAQVPSYEVMRQIIEGLQ